MDEQLHLLTEVQELLPEEEILVCISKGDLLDGLPEDWGDSELSYLDRGPVFSVHENIGVEGLRAMMMRHIMTVQRGDPMTLPEGWHRRDHEDSQL